jgi:hypothetical protein
MNKRTWIVGALTLLGALAGCGDDGNSAAAAQAQRAADDYEMTQMAIKWHEAVSTKNVDLAMSLFADDAVLTAAGKSHSGKDEIRKLVSTQLAPFKPENHWTSLTHAPNIRHTVSGDRGTLYFECHYFDLNTRQLANSVSADTRLARVGGKWVFTNLVTGNAILG